MAVTVTSADVARAIRAVVSTEVTEELTGLLAYARNEVVRIAPLAPDIVHDRAAILTVGYIYDKPTAARGQAYANALRHSGAKIMLLPYRVHRAGPTSRTIKTRGGFSRGFSRGFNMVMDR